MKKPLPPRDAAWFDVKTGRPTEIFFDWAKDIDGRVLRDPVAVASPTNGQVMIFNSSTGLWTPGAN
ncbi:MAG: hypothetical protein IJ935_07475 [Afipia sp.]|nr:hypothetical protein [Afipia sp.]